ncbi:tetratricopeptide repeat protein [candidate division KSB1 bacterium]
MFLSASLLHAYMGELETLEMRDELLHVTSAAATIIENRLDINPADISARFYLGTLKGYLAVLYNREGRILNTISNARSGNNMLLECLRYDEDFPEVHIANGTYRYWKSAKNFFRFLPGIPDERNDGIKEIQDHLEPGSISYAFGINQLIWIYVDHKQLDLAEAAVRKGLDYAPDSRFFLYPAGIVAQRQRKWREAAAFFERLNDSLEEDGFRERYFWVKTAVKRAECLMHLERYSDALLLCRLISGTVVPGYETNDTKPLLQRATDIEKKCLGKND